MSRSDITLRRRDYELVRAAWSLGWVTCRVLTDVVSPGTSAKTLSGRLSQLTAAGFLRRRRVIGGPGGHLWLYGAGRKASAIDPAYADAWRPPDFHLAHTIEVGDTLATSHRADSAQSRSSSGRAKQNCVRGTSPATRCPTWLSVGCTKRKSAHGSSRSTAAPSPDTRCAESSCATSRHPTVESSSSPQATNVPGTSPY